MVTKRAKTAIKQTVKKDRAAEETKLRDYELVLIFRPETTEAKIDSVVEHLSKPIVKQGGAVGEMERWGKRRLAYPIKHATEGIYLLFKFSSLPSVAKSLTPDLRISEEVLRYMLINQD